MSGSKHQSDTAKLTAIEEKVEVLSTRLDAIEVGVIKTLNSLIDEIQEYHKFNDLKNNDKFWRFKNSLFQA